MTYVLGDGVEARRHSSWSATQGSNGPSTWRTIALVTSEMSFDVIADSASEKRMDGEKARAIDIPALSSGCSTIIDRFSKSAGEDEPSREKWAREKVEALRAACAANHGVALEPYLKYLMKRDQSKLREQIVQAQATFVAAVDSMLTSEPLRHAAKNFGVIYAGGLQAMRAGLLKLDEKGIMDRLVACFARGVGATVTRPDPLAVGLKQLSIGLRTAVTQAEAGKLDDVFRVEKVGSETTFVVSIKTVFSPWFGGDLSVARATLRWLHEKGLLVVANDKALDQSNFTFEAVTSVRKFKGRDVRCIVFRNPRKELYAAFPELRPKAAT